MIYKYVFIVIACLLASIIISYFFYYYKAKTDGRVTLMFFLLRIISVFAVLLVFVNIEISYTDYIEIKPKLVFLFDDSKSMADKSILIKEEYNKLRNSDFITDNYEVKYYKFGKNATLLDSLSFKEKQTDIYNSLNNIDIINRDSKAELFIVTDGISTSGYEYSDILYSNTINIVHSEFGITMEDVFIKKVNYNKKASVDTKFEIEVMTEYYGDRSVELELILKKGTKTLFRRAIKLDAKQNRALDVFELKENTKGFKEYRISISNLKDEKNTINNSKKINIEIGDYSQKVLLVYDKLHPDIGVLKRSVAKTYKINTVKIDDLDYKVLQNTDLTIVYQPNKKFEKLINKLNSTSINSLFVTGTKTDWGLLNSVNLSFNKKNRGGVLDAYPVVNHSYSAFSTRIDMQEYPPLKYTKGLVKYNDNFETLISIKGGQDYILATAKVQNKKVGLWQGEGLWLWRMYSYSEETKFEQFDSFMTDIIKYMSVKNYASRMQLDYKTEVYNNEPFEINVSKYNVNNKIDLRDDLFLI
ncbi:MAG: hypothetical protein HRT66_00210 [Flavobacteriaceae bacterium]|nr:hypothetical protein [Flavobacteriaceae bacterium]